LPSLFQPPLTQDPTTVQPDINVEVVETLVDEVECENLVVVASKVKPGRKKMTDEQKKAAKALRVASKQALSTQATQSIASAQSVKRKPANFISSDDE
jgi:arsenate reductase-like glutaredoxin family protein